MVMGGFIPTVDHTPDVSCSSASTWMPRKRCSPGIFCAGKISYLPPSHSPSGTGAAGTESTPAMLDG